jgi:peptidoglycan/LPS O-acetylase OafA/YrhL
MNHHNNFNFLRIFAAVLVAVTHSYAITGHPDAEPLHLVSNGYFYFSSIGLYIFFFTSGYLVSRSAATSKSPLVYLKKRALRIYPALVCVVLLSVFIAGPVLTTFSLKQYFTDPDTWKYLWTASGLKIMFRLPGVFEQPGFAMAGFNGSLWSITLELELYGLLLILMALGIFKKKTLLLVVLIACSAICLGMSISGRYFIIVAGQKNTLLACAFLFGGIMQANFIPKKYAVYLFAASGLLLLLKTTYVLPVNILVDEVIFFSLATYFIAFTHRLTIPIRNDISYGVYIYTFPLQQLIFQLSGFSQPALANLFLSLCCSAILALVSWLYIEKRALKYKSHLS